MKNDAHQYDCCIVGTGAAGGILAHRLAMQGLNVISLEQGHALPKNYFSKINPPGVAKNFGIKPDTVFPPNPDDALFLHELFADPSIRSSYPSATHAFKHFQIMQLNGLQNLWNGVSVRFSPDDFSGWPIQYADLSVHYTAVEKRITVCGTEEGLLELPDGAYIAPKPLRPADTLIVDATNRLNIANTYAIPNRKAIETRKEKSYHCISTGYCTSGCPVDAVYKFSSHLLPEIQQRENYTLRLNAKVTRLICDPATNNIQTIEYLDTQTEETHHVKAKFFILAAGAIETPRILMNSTDDRHPTGLANSSDCLGRYLQDNPKSVVSSSLYKLWGKPPAEDMGYGDLLLLLSQATLNDGSTFKFIGHSIHSTPDIPYYLQEFANIPKFLKPYVCQLLFNSFVVVALFCQGDIHAENRIMRSDRRDKFSVPQVAIQFNVSETTEEKMDKMLIFAKKLLRKASATKMLTAKDNSGTGIHYAGTCRMSHTADTGVVDQNLRTFDHGNLFICDGSVIPILPDKHITLTIMALADRLADHLIGMHGVPE